MMIDVAAIGRYDNRGALASFRRSLSGEAIDQLVGAHVAELLADAALEIMIVGAQPAELELQRRVGLEQFPMRGFELGAPPTQYY